MISVFINILTVFAMVLIGYIACKKDIIPFAANDYFVKLLLSICIPCMIISSVATKTLSDDTFTQIMETIIGTSIYFVVGAIISYFIVKLLKYDPASDQGVLMVILTSVNSGFMGFPITRALFGDDTFFLMVMNHSVLTVYLYSILIMQLNVGSHRGERRSLKEILKPFCNACMIAAVLGFVILFAKIKLPEFIVNLTSTLGDATTPISMLVVGLQLSQSDFKKVLKNRKLIVVSLCNVVLMPLLTFLAVHWLPIANISKVAIIFGVAFPTAVITVALASNQKKNAGLMAEGVALTTLFSMVTLPLTAMALITLYC